MNPAESGETWIFGWDEGENEDSLNKCPKNFKRFRKAPQKQTNVQLLTKPEQSSR
jgi:hypothetical protein